MHEQLRAVAHNCSRRSRCTPTREAAELRCVDRERTRPDLRLFCVRSLAAAPVRRVRESLQNQRSSFMIHASLPGTFRVTPARPERANPDRREPRLYLQAGQNPAISEAQCTLSAARGILSRSGPAIAVIGLHVLIVYGLVVSMGIVEMPKFAAPVTAVFIPEQTEVRAGTRDQGETGDRMRPCRSMNHSPKCSSMSR